MTNHEKSLIAYDFHLGIYGIVKKENKILFVKKQRGPYVSKWDLPGGRPEHGESIFQTLKREIEEESGLLVKKATFHSNQVFLINYDLNGQKRSLHHTCLVYLITDFDTRHYNPSICVEDVSHNLWIDISELRPDQLSPLANHARNCFLGEPFEGYHGQKI